MIKVLINGTPIYKLYFQRKPYAKLKNGTPLYETSAIIQIADAKKDEPPVASATARQYHKDKYSPEESRVAALKMLLDDRVRLAHDEKVVVVDLDTSKLLGKTPFDRRERTAIWDAYLNRPKGKPDTPKKPSGAAGVPPAIRPVLQARSQPTHKVIRFPSFPPLQMTA